METPKSIKKITYYKDREKELSIIKTDGNELLFAAHQIFKLTDANEVLNDPYVLINDDNMITLDKEKFSNLLDVTAKVYNDEGVIIENDPVKFFWSDNKSTRTEPIIFIDESGLDDILFNLVTFDYSDVSNWIESMISRQEYNIPKNEETNSSNKLTKIKGAAYLGGNYLDTMGLTDIPVIVDSKDTPWFDLISVLDYIDIDKKLVRPNISIDNKNKVIMNPNELNDILDPYSNFMYEGSGVKDYSLVICLYDEKYVANNYGLDITNRVFVNYDGIIPVIKDLEYANKNLSTYIKTYTKRTIEIVNMANLEIQFDFLLNSIDKKGFDDVNNVIQDLKKKYDIE